MVRHTHQDFLSAYDATNAVDLNVIALSAEELSRIRPLTEPMDLFDFPGPYRRKVNLSELDEFIDDQTDWLRFTNRLQDLQQLILVDDRNIVNPLMTDYDRTTKSRYAHALAAFGCPCAFTRPHLLDQ